MGCSCTHRPLLYALLAYVCMIFEKKYSKQDHTCLYLYDILKKYFLIVNNEFQLLGTNILITRTNNYFLLTKR